MTLETIRQSVLGSGGILMIVLTIIQFSPIKINPWSWVARAIGRAINKDVLDQVKEVREELNDHKEKSEERHATLCRSHILRFGDELLHGTPHSKEAFDSILLDIDSYEEYCDKHPGYKNNVAMSTISHIKRTYQKHLDDNSFLR